MLDTSVLLNLEIRQPETIAKLKNLKAEISPRFHITTFTYSEVYLGFLEKTRENREKMEEELNQFPLLNTDLRSSKLYAHLKYQLKKTGKAIPDFDLLIASIALAHNLPVITEDKHFQEIPDLKVITF
ncbi:MAG: type II toxin-antitoxin system VapC family toxin [Candidatus Altiarchaeota archaeon]